MRRRAKKTLRALLTWASEILIIAMEFSLVEGVVGNPYGG